MKRLPWIFLFFSIFYCAGGQPNSDYGIFGGVSTYLGDINPGRIMYSPLPAAGILYRYNLHPRQAIRGSIFYGGLRANDLDFNNVFQTTRNSSFTGSVAELAAQFEFNFLPYKTGTYIPDKMKIPDGMPSDKYETTFIYEKDGQQKEFTLDNYPANDTTWMFVDQRSVLVSKGYTPQIHDLVLTTADNEDITETVLKSKGYTFLMICKKLEEADTDKLDEGMELGRKLSTAGFDFYILTASGAEEITKYDKSLAFCSVDETTLKTIVRSNPGYIMLKEGTIMGKWSWAGVPSFDWLKNEYLNNN